MDYELSVLGVPCLGLRSHEPELTFLEKTELVHRAVRLQMIPRVKLSCSAMHEGFPEKSGKNFCVKVNCGFEVVERSVELPESE